jgi:hypothetical protein
LRSYVLKGGAGAVVPRSVEEEVPDKIGTAVARESATATHRKCGGGSGRAAPFGSERSRMRQSAEEERAAVGGRGAVLAAFADDFGAPAVESPPQSGTDDAFRTRPKDDFRGE